jgi:hypothetical protein
MANKPNSTTYVPPKRPDDNPFHNKPGKNSTGFKKAVMDQVGIKEHGGGR